jgi:AcrR family transcriptional regulator
MMARNIEEKANDSDRRNHLVSVAMRLFRDRGYHATGIDTVLAESGVAKRTLYLHFAGKDDLIVAVLAQRDQQWREWFREAIKTRATKPADRLLAIFDALEEWFNRSDFHGCMFINAAAEYPRLSSPIHRETQRHKQLVREIVIDLVEAAGTKDPLPLVDGLCLLMEGAIVNAQITGTCEPARQARAVAVKLVSSSLGK